jgi:hypothetical protein
LYHLFFKVIISEARFCQAASHVVKTEERRTVSTQETITQTLMYARILHGTNDNQELSAPPRYRTASLVNLYPTFRENLLASLSRVEISYFLVFWIFRHLEKMQMC